ncbi:MAG TPA: CDP-alcohol phosphatidyltransferase family protein [bacterium]|nr:CDP-alcohol phosphatidyltransferase family protein [bacterium]
MLEIVGINPVWITLGPIVLINLALFISYLIYQLWGRKRLAREFQGAKNQGSELLSSGTREWWFWTTDPIVRLFVKLKLGPNAITMMGFLIASVAGVLFAIGSFGYAGWVMIFGASFDMFDGRVARITGRMTRSGAFFDAVMDRFSEGVCLLGLAWYFRDGFMLPIVIAALIGSMLVSYTRAKGDGVGVDCKVGWMQRPERIVYLGVASVFDPLMGVALHRWWAEPTHMLLILAVCFVALMTNATAVYRMIFIMNALDTEDRRGKDSIPQIITKLSTQEGREQLWEKARYGYDRGRGEFDRVVLFLAGGLGKKLMDDLLRRGDLPNIASHTLSRGGEADGVTAFPSTLGPSITPFVTGAFPGTCDIPGVRWFDRSVPSGRVLSMNRFRDYMGWGAYAMDHDLAKSVKTIFEYSRQAVNLFGMLNRGCGLIRDPAFFRMAGRFHRVQGEEEVAEAEDAAFRWFASAIRREADFVLYSFPSIEGSADTPASMEIARHALRRIDEYVGRAADLLKEQASYEKTALIFAGGYGAGEQARSFDLDGFLSKRYRIHSAGAGTREWQDADLVSLPSGTSMAHLYVRGDGGWEKRPFFEEIERKGLVGSLLEQNGVDLLAGRSVEGGIVVQSRRGRSHLHEDADGRITSIVKGGDPFGYEGMEQVTDAAISLESSASTEYPDGPLQMLQIFRSMRSGDLVLSAAADSSIVAREISGIPVTHGSLSRAHMSVPILSSVKPPSSTMRTADIFSWAIAMLGIEAEHKTDGSLLQLGAPTGDQKAAEAT